MEAVLNSQRWREHGFRSVQGGNKIRIPALIGFNAEHAEDHLKIVLEAVMNLAEQEAFLPGVRR
jgi:hypothetical protein